MRAVIYGYIDSNRQMRYVGMTTRELRLRLRQHTDAATGRIPPKRQFHWWLKGVIASKQAYRWVVIEIVTDDDGRSLQDIETGWITYFDELGCELWNGTHLKNGFRYLRR